MEGTTATTTDHASRVFNTLLDEYKIQRAAATSKLTTAQQTITFGGATTGILIAAGFNIWKQPVPAMLIFLVVIPLVSTLVVVQWVGQMRSFDRTRQYINALEEAMLTDLRAAGEVPVALFGKQTPTTGRWYQPDHRWFQNAAIVVFGLIAAGALAVGIYKGYANHRTLVLAVGITELVFLSMVAILLLLSLRRRPEVPVYGSTPTVE